MTRVGVVGLGNMGSAHAANLVGSGFDVTTNDRAGEGRSPAGATFVDDVSALAAQVDVAVLSLPDGRACATVSDEIRSATSRRVAQVVDTSTIGVHAARAIHAGLAEVGVGYVDAPVSGGVSGARARTLAVMFAGDDAACDAAAPVLAGLSDRRRRVGSEPGMAQALKLANNFLSATTLAATSEAVAFGRSVGLDIATMIEVLDQSSGRSGATNEKFPDHVLTETYASGFANTLMAKDLDLYLAAADSQEVQTEVGQVTAALWRRFVTTEPGVDFTRIYPFVAGPSEV